MTTPSTPSVLEKVRELRAEKESVHKGEVQGDAERLRVFASHLFEAFPEIAESYEALVAENERLDDLKNFVILMSGCHRGREDDIAHLKEMHKTAFDEWMEENKNLKAECKRYREALEKSVEETCYCEWGDCSHDASKAALNPPTKS